jgi:glutathione S-transferase
VSLPKLYHLRFSHFNEKGRWALDYKGVQHVRTTAPPGLHIATSRLHGGKGTMPLLVTDEGRFADSADIVAELERTHPDPPLYPSDEAERERALELERWLGREFGPAIRSALFTELLGERREATATMFQGLSPVSRKWQDLNFPLTRGIGRRTLPAQESRRDEFRGRTVEGMDRIESELQGSGYLVGDSFTVADLTAASLLFPLVSPPQYEYEVPDPWPERWEEFKAEHRGRPAWEYAERMYERHRGESAEVPAT